MLRIGRVSLTDIIYLQHVLILKFNLNCTIFCNNSIKKTYRIKIKNKSMPNLRLLVSPYMHPSMLYKLGI